MQADILSLLTLCRIRTECTSQLRCKYSYYVLCEVTNHLPIGVQVSCAAVVTHCGSRNGIKTCLCEAITDVKGSEG